MRIAQVAPRGEQPWSGVLTVIVHLAAALARRGHRVDVWQLHEWPADAYTDQHRLLLAGGVVQVPVPSSRRLGRSAAALAEQRGIDVVHLHGAFNLSNTAISRALRRPYVFSPHGGYDPVSLRRSRTRKVAYRILFERRMLQRAASLVALTDAELADIRAFGATRPCEVIPNGVEPPAEDLDAEAFRRELGLPHDALLAVFVGRLDVHRKGLDVLVRGVAEAPGWHLALVGPRFRDVERLESMIVDLRLGDRVHLVCERHGRSLRESVCAADLFVLMSRWEGLPMVLLEALALGRPALVSAPVEGSVPVAGVGAGWVSEDADLGTVLREIARMGRDELDKRGREALLLSRRFDWDSVAESYEAVYERARESRPRVTP